MHFVLVLDCKYFKAGSNSLSKPLGTLSAIKISGLKDLTAVLMILERKDIISSKGIFSCLDE